MKPLMAALVVLVSCGGGEVATPNRGTRPLTIEVPATIVGTLDISVEEGPVGDDDLSEVNFGSVATPEGPVLIEVWADVVRASGLTRAELVSGDRFRIELSGPAENAGPEIPGYLVVALTPLD